MPEKTNKSSNKATPKKEKGVAKKKAKPVKKEGKKTEKRKVRAEKKTVQKRDVGSAKAVKGTVESLQGKEEKKLRDRYLEAVGRRKTAVARVRLFTSGKSEIIVNGKKYKDYFPTLLLQKAVEAPLEKISCLDKFRFTIKISGGGISGQAEACRHGIARTLVALNPYFRKRLKKAGFLTRDSRAKERKKFGLKRARKAPQWSKR